MKKFVGKIIDYIPYAILIIPIIAVILFIEKNGLLYDQLIGLIETLIWPAIVLSAIIFFRKVFTYLFFSMEEFNFFGNRGGLKNIQEVIEERVQRRIEAEQEEKEKQLAVKKIENELENAKQSKDNLKIQAEGNLGLAREIFEKYKALSDEDDKLKKELSILRKKKADKQARIVEMRKRIKRYQEEKYRGPSPEEIDAAIDAAGDEYIQQKIDEQRGK